MAKLGYDVKITAPPDKFENFEEIVDYLTITNKELNEQLSDIFEEFDGKIEFSNLKHTVIDIADTGSANTDFTVTHNLGRIPTFYFYIINTSTTAKAGIVYKGSLEWTTTTITLRCTVANSVLKVLILL